MIKYLLDSSDKTLNKVFTGIVYPSSSFPDLPTVNYEDYLADIKRYEQQEKEAAFSLAIRTAKKLREREAEELKKTKKYSAKAIRLLELREPKIITEPKEPKQASRKARRLSYYTREDVGIIASAALAVGMKNSHADIPDDQFDEYVSQAISRANRIINDYDEFNTLNELKHGNI